MAVDPSNPPSPDDAQATFEEVCKLLGADPDQPDEARQALESLIAAAGADGTAPDPTDPSNASGVIKPPIVNSVIGALPPVSLAAVQRGRRAFLPERG
jgi:hypothetical protein